MIAAAQPQVERWDAWAGDPGMESESKRKARNALRWLLYLYVLLWVFEGAARKWIVPGLANPLLIVRDPVVLMIFAVATIGGFWPRTVFLPLLAIITGLFTVGGFLAETSMATVMIYGIRSNFMHLPLIFLIPRAFNSVDVRRMGKWALILSVPMVILMTLQFKAGPDAYVNAGAGKGSAQLDSAMGKVRASGTWSFVVGPVCFYSFVAAYLFYGQTTKKAVGIVLSLTGACTLVLAGAVAGSRSLIAGAAASFGFFIIGLALHPPSLVKAGRIVVLGAVAWAGISAMSIFKESQEVMAARIENAKSSGSMIERVLSFFELGLSETTMFGKGLGKGTNVGAALLGKKGEFLLAEDEWKRITLESGYLFAPLFILYRVGLFTFLLVQALKAAKKGNMLPMCLLGSCGINVLTGQFGVPTMQGFTCFTGGMVLAACDPLVAANVKYKDLKLLASGRAPAELRNGSADFDEAQPASHIKAMLPKPRNFKPVRPGSNGPATPPPKPPQEFKPVRPVRQLTNPNPFIVRPNKPTEKSSDETPPRP